MTDKAWKYQVSKALFIRSRFYQFVDSIESEENGFYDFAGCPVQLNKFSDLLEESHFLIQDEYENRQYTFENNCALELFLFANSASVCGIIYLGQVTSSTVN